MSPEIPGTLLFTIIALPIAFAWHSLVGNYLLASFLATVNIIFLVSILLLLNCSIGHYLATMLVLAVGASFAISFTVGLPFLFYRRKEKSDKKS